MHLTRESCRRTSQPPETRRRPRQCANRTRKMRKVRKAELEGDFSQRRGTASNGIPRLPCTTLEPEDLRSYAKGTTKAS